MRKVIVLVFVASAVGLAMTFAAGDKADDEKQTLKNQHEKISYSVGLSIGRDFKDRDVVLDLGLVDKGIRDGYTGRDALLSQEEFKKSMAMLEQEIRGKAVLRAREMAEKNKKAGAAFLAENKRKEGVREMPSGLQYKVIRPGEGDSPGLDDTVTVHYRGTLLDGTEFDSSYARGEPASFPLNAVIAGWREGLQLMEVGAKWQLFIPSDQAYGERGAPPHIKPNSTLVFEVELISIDEAGEE